MDRKAEPWWAHVIIAMMATLTLAAAALSTFQRLYVLCRPAHFGCIPCGYKLAGHLIALSHWHGATFGPAPYSACILNKVLCRCPDRPAAAVTTGKKRTGGPAGAAFGGGRRGGAPPYRPPFALSGEPLGYPCGRGGAASFTAAASACRPSATRFSLT
jgi:hypothetical protein